MNLLVIKLIVLIIALSSFVPNSVKCANLSESESEEYQEAEKADLVYRIIRSYLLKQLHDFEQTKNKLDIQNELLSRHKTYDRRQLKSQGLFERLKNKLDHDLSRYGWDK